MISAKAPSSCAALWFYPLSIHFCIQLASSVVTRSPRLRGSPRTRSVGLLQWNMHGECFVQCPKSSAAAGLDSHCDQLYPYCKNNATAYLRGLLMHDSSLDFAGIEQLNDKQFLESGLPAEAWAQITHVCGGSEGYGVYPFDSASLIYNKLKWDVLDVDGKPAAPEGGCMQRVTKAKADRTSVVDDESETERNYRAFIVQAFKRKYDGMKMLVVVSHNPHTLLDGTQVSLLRQSIDGFQNATGVKALVFIADTNWLHPAIQPSGRSSRHILKDIDPDAEKIVSTSLHKTCCAWTYDSEYDRIIAASLADAVGPIETTLPLGGSLPAWAALNMHRPIQGILRFDSDTA